MVDVGTVAKIVEVALKIKGAVDTVKQNENICKQIKRRVEILCLTLSEYQNNKELMNSLAVRYALEALDEILVEAFKLVTSCQEETNFACLFYTSGKMSRQLIQVDQRISNMNLDALQAILNFLVRKQSNHDGANPPSPQVNFSSRPAPFQVQAMEPPSPSKQMHKGSQSREDVNVQTGGSYGAFFTKAGEEILSREEFFPRVPEQEEGYYSQWDSSMDALCSCCAMAREREPVRRQPSTQRSLLDQIEEVALDIQEAAETVIKNKDDCIEIDKRVTRASVVLSQLKNRDMVEEQVMKDMLKKLLETFRHARTLVMACQRSGSVSMLIRTQLPSKLSRQLSVLLDQLVPDVNAMVAVILNCTLRPERYTRARNAPGQPVREQPVVRPPRQTEGDAEAFIGPTYDDPIFSV